MFLICLQTEDISANILIVDIVVPYGIPAIVPKVLFDRVQERIAKNKKSPTRNRADEEYILSTKLYCGKCMTFMVCESGTARNKETYRYYNEYSGRIEHPGRFELNTFVAYD